MFLQIAPLSVQKVRNSMQRTGAMEVFEQQTTINVNGVELVFYPEEQMYGYPMPQGSTLKILYDQKSGQFLPVTNSTNALFRERMATAPDGSTLRERVIYRDPKTITDLTIEEQHKLARLRKAQWQAETWETINLLRPVFVIGLAITMVVFFFQVISALGELATLVATRAAMALADITPYAVYLTFVLLTLIVLRFALPAIFRKRVIDVDESITKDAGGGVNINVQYGPGQFGSQYNTESEAQRFLSNRNL